MRTLGPRFGSIQSASTRPKSPWPWVPSLLGQRLRVAFAIALARFANAAIRALNLGAGSVFPGTIASFIHPDLISILSSEIPNGVILIAGTNGKTTTAHLLRSILERHGWRVVQNITGANLENGLVAALLQHASFDGRVEADCAIFEIDENVLPRLSRRLKLRTVVCLNLFRDQLDRYGEVDSIIRRWTRTISSLPQETVVILNADDPRLSYMGQQLKQRVLYFGLDEPESFIGEIPHAADSVFCPRCGARLEYRGYYLSHLGDFSCKQCGFKRSPISLDSRDWPQALAGLYNKYNTLAAVLAAKSAGAGARTIRASVTGFHAAFGRAEDLDVHGKHVRILLSKNPAGMNETIRLLRAEHPDGLPGVAMLVLNDRIPDGTDVSWIWDVDTEKLNTRGMRLVISGDRAYEMGLRVQYGSSSLKDGPKVIVQRELREALRTALGSTADGQTLYVLPTYSAMLEVRRLLLGHSIL